jgi:hypothetical protein
MRRDFFIENDSGGFSVIAGDALDAVIEDQRSDDLAFVTSFKALLLELYGDDSMPVRIVVDEPLRPDEEEQWLARASWRIDASDGRLIVMGGFDPDMLSSWKDETGGTADGRGVAIAEVPAGSLRVDVYAHVGSMNGREILSEAKLKPGAAFRRSHPDRPFPLWLANMLDGNGDEDPKHEDAWDDVRASIEAGELSVDTETASFIGFLIHVQQNVQSPGEPPEGGWFPRDVNARVPKTFPIGLATDVADPDLEIFLDGLLGRNKEDDDPPQPVTTTVEIMEAWAGDPLAAIRHNLPAVSLAPANAFWLYWMAGLTSDSSPRFEYCITPKAQWTVPETTTDYGVIVKGSVIALRPSSEMGGWGLWHGARHASALLSTVPEGSSIEVAMAPHMRGDEDADEAIGRAMYRGVIRNGRLELNDASPAIDRATLADALEFVGYLATNEQILVRGEEERDVFDMNAMIYASGDDTVVWDDEAARLAEPDFRTLLMLASPVFRKRFGEQWKCDED